jgi:GDPmannose 4,6-dehydratase
LGNLDVSRDWGWAPEYVEAMWRMLQRKEPEDFVVATGVTSSLADFCREAFAQVGLEWREHVESRPSLLRPSDLKISRALPEKARRLLPWQARRTMPEVVAELVRERQREDRA